MKRARSFFVTGTDTEIGKTVVSCAFLRAFAQAGLRAAAMKPIAAGAFERNGQWYNEDTEQLDAAANVTLPASIRTPYLLKTPAAPHIVAMQEGVRFDIEHIVRCHKNAITQADIVIVEGVGGFCVPLSDRETTADLAQALKLPIVLVVGIRLGCINHALITAEAIATRHLRLTGWVANCIDPTMSFVDENIETLRTQLSARYHTALLGVLPHHAPVSADTFAKQLDIAKLCATLEHC